MPVQGMNSEIDVQRDVQAKKNAGMSLRAIAKIYGKPILFTDIDRILKGKFPAGEEKRKALHIPPVCPVCYRILPKPPRQVPTWLVQAVANLQRLEAAANVPDAQRVYARGGKRVRL